MTKKNITKTTLAVSLDIDVAERIKLVAKQEERSVSQIVQRALVHYLPMVQRNTCHHESVTKEHSINALVGAVPSDQF